MLESVIAQKEPETPKVAGAAYAVRQGLLLLSVPHEERHQDALQKRVGAICDALKADSRVNDLQRPPHRPHQSRVVIMYPRITSESELDALSGNDHIHTFRLSDPIEFRVTVASENQPEFRGYKNIPKGSYWVAWDGVVLIVLWEQSSDKGVSRAGGRVVTDVLEEAVAKAGGQTYTQACSPGCLNRFTHTDVILTTAGVAHPKARSGLHVVHREELLGPVAELRLWFDFIGYPFFLFANYKNHARRIRDLVSLSGKRLTSMLKLHQQHSVTSMLKFPDRLRKIRAMRGWRRSAELQMADVWLASAAIEVLRREWDEERRRFKDKIQGPSIAPLFQLDFADDESAIDSIDMSLARDALAHSSSRLDTRTMVLVTAFVGLAGLIGAILGAALAS